MFYALLEVGNKMSDEKALISVVIPVYKTESFLPRCLESVVSQTFKTIEIILVDDGSPDRCPQICDEWACKDHRIRVIHQTNQGPNSAIVAGVTSAKGSYIAFVDSDDWIEPPMLDALFKAAVQYKADCVRCGIQMIDPDGSRRLVGSQKLQIYDAQGIEEQILTPFWEDNANLYVNWSNGRWDKLFRADILKKVLPELDLHLSMGEDAELNLRILPRCEKVVSLPDAYYYCNIQNPTSMTHGFSTKLLDQNKEYLQALYRLCQEQERGGRSLLRLSDRLYAGVAFQAMTANNAMSKDRIYLILQARAYVMDWKFLVGEFSKFNIAVRRGMHLIAEGKVKRAVYVYSNLIQAVRWLKRKAGR